MLQDPSAYIIKKASKYLGAFLIIHYYLFILNYPF
jgi:hypothetical protein